jgi:hypothetical protein
MTKVLKAFNFDMDYLNNELPAKKDFKEFVKFLKQFISPVPQSRLLPG